MKRTLEISAIKVGSVIKEIRRPLLIAGLVASGLTVLPGCLSDGSCSDVDISADPAARRDTGPGQDPSDLGISDTDVGVADPGGAGRCTDFD